MFKTLIIVCLYSYAYVQQPYNTPLLFSMFTFIYECLIYLYMWISHLSYHIEHVHIQTWLYLSWQWHNSWIAVLIANIYLLINFFIRTYPVFFIVQLIAVTMYLNDFKIF